MVRLRRNFTVDAGIAILLGSISAIGGADITMKDLRYDQC
jgi:hypothetical protein